MRSRFLGAVMLCAFLVAASAAAGPVSPWFLTAGDQRNDWVVQGTGVVTSWSTGSFFEYPIVVLSTVRTTSPGVGQPGGEYSLAGVPTGSTFTNGLATGNAYDAATDGTSIFMVNWVNGQVTRLDLNYANPQVLFTPAGGGANLAITYDPANNSLWIAGWTTGTIADYSLSGTLLSSFTVPYTSLTCLALDRADGTLWFGSQNTQGTFYQYSRAGAALSTQVYPALASQNTLGGEFAVAAGPAVEIPLFGGAALAALVLGLAACGYVILRRA